MPAAAVRRRMQVLFGMIGRKESVGRIESLLLNASANRDTAKETSILEGSRGTGNSRWSGEMRRYREEHQYGEGTVLGFS